MTTIDYPDYFGKIAASVRASERERCPLLDEVAVDIDAYRRGERFLLAEELPIPCEVKVAGEWCRYEGTRGDAVMEVFPEGCAAPQFVGYCEDESFAWRSL